MARIAHRLSLAEATVEIQRACLRRKFHVSNSMALAARLCGCCARKPDHACRHTAQRRDVAAWLARAGGQRATFLSQRGPPVRLPGRGRPQAVITQIKISQCSESLG